MEIRRSQYGFVQNRSCETNLICLFLKKISLGDCGNTVDILISQLLKCEQDDSTVKWVHSWLENHAQRMLFEGILEGNFE